MTPTQWSKLLVFIYNNVPGAKTGASFTPDDLKNCPDYAASGRRALARDLRRVYHFAEEVSHEVYRLTVPGVSAARFLVES